MAAKANDVLRQLRLQALGARYPNELSGGQQQRVADQEEALAVSDIGVVMNNAVVAQTGSPRELHDRPCTRFVADFIGGANVLPCEIMQVHADGEGERCQVRLGSLGMEVGHCAGSAAERHVAVRPNRVALLPGGSPHMLEAEIRKSTYVGQRMKYIVQTPLAELFVTAADTLHPFKSGDAVAVRFDAGEVVLLQD